jgi:hypothetical protein
MSMCRDAGRPMTVPGLAYAAKKGGWLRVDRSSSPIRLYDAIRLRAYLANADICPPNGWVRAAVFAASVGVSKITVYKWIRLRLVEGKQYGAGKGLWWVNPATFKPIGKYQARHQGGTDGGKAV